MTDKQIIIDKLKNDVACKENIINHLAEYNIKLQDQLDQLKAQLLDQEAETLRAGGIIYTLEKTLTEIKEIAEILAPMTDEYENCYDRDRCFECDFTEDCSYFNTKRIIQICDGATDE